MVKSYQRYEQADAFGVIASHSNSIYLPPKDSKSSGRAITAGLEEILIWDIKTGELISKLKDGVNPGALVSSSQTAPQQVVSLEYEPNSNIVASGYEDGSIKIWDITSSSVVINFKGHKSAVTKMKFDKSGTRLVSGSKDTTVIVWDLVGEEGLFKLKGHRDQITGLQLLSSNENQSNIDDIDDWLITTSKDGLIKLWDLKSQQCIETHVAHTGECWSSAINKTNELLITSGIENQLKIWKIDLTKDKKKLIEVGQIEKTSKSRGLNIEFAEINQGELFFVSNADKTVQLFRLRSEKEISKGISKRKSRLEAKGLSEEEIEESIKSSMGNILLCDFTSIFADKSKIRSATWGLVNNRVMNIMVTLTNNSLTYYQITVPENVKKHKPIDKIVEEKNTLEYLGHRTDIRAVDISDDDKLLVTGSNNQLKVWNIKRRSCIRTFEKTGYVLSSKFLPGGTLVVVGTKEGWIGLYDLVRSTVLDVVDDAHSGSAIWSIDITPDGKGIVTGSADKTVKFWEIKVEEELVDGTLDKYTNNLKLNHTKTLELNEDVLCVKISPDCKLLSVSLLDNTVKVFFYDTLKFFLSLYGHKLPVLSMDISFDSKLIITSSADKNIKIWGLDFGDCHKSIFGHQDSIMNVKFVPATKNFFSCSKDGLVKYWDGIKFENIQKLAAHHSEVWNLAISSTGEFLVSVSHDHSIRIWEETDDQVFIEEEREKEMDELYEKELLENLEGDNLYPTKNSAVNGEVEDENDDNKVEKVSKQTMETLKSGEKLMEALDTAIVDIEADEQYQKDSKAFKLKKISQAPIEPTKNPLLLALNISPEKHVLDTLTKIRAAQLDDALIVLPFSYSVKLLKFIKIWTNSSNIKSNLTNLSVICKTLFFIIENNSIELISQKDDELKKIVTVLKEQLREALRASVEQVGYNVAGLTFLKDQWSMNHNVDFSPIDDKSGPNGTSSILGEQKSRKRMYTTLA
ncbi:hypothetical protein B5S33_g1731 [[Candida] boidinii]|nr:hypothetical protein B5S33_g1731 [[Candida] boidinii]